jgi:hypothetical protein
MPGCDDQFLNQEPECVFTKGACHIFAYRLIQEKGIFIQPFIGYYFQQQHLQMRSNNHQKRTHKALHVFIADGNHRFDVRGKYCKEEFLKYWRDEKGIQNLEEKLFSADQYMLLINPVPPNSEDNILGLYSKPQFVKQALVLAENYLPQYMDTLR